MLAPARRTAPRGIPRQIPCCAAQTRSFTYPTAITKKVIEQFSRTEHPLASELKRIGAWQPKARRLTRKEVFETGQYEELTGPIAWNVYDSKRVNVVSEALCAQSIDRLRPSLKKHEGCDLLDINPGAGLWSKHLHDAVKPRNHLMVEGRAKLYEQVIADQMGDRNHEIIEEPGLNWHNLGNVMSEYLDPHHARIKPGDEQHVKNDLLVTVNLTGWPTQPLARFKDMNRMTIYQIMASVPNSKIFQRYGNVRFFMWMNDFNKRHVLPRSATNREAGPFEYEMSCDYIREVCGFDTMDKATRTVTVRDEHMNIESAARALKQMEADGVVTPPGRETAYMKQILADPSLREPLVGVQPPRIVRPYEDELANMEEEAPLDEGSEPISRRHLDLRIRQRNSSVHSVFHHDMLLNHTRLLEMDPSDAGYDELLRKYSHDLESLKHMVLSDYILLRDNYHLWRHQKNGIPALHWDRRPYEPLVVDPSEFYPNVPLALLDVQPRAIDPVINQTGPGTTRSRDYASVILKMIMSGRKTKIPLFPRMLDSVQPGLGNLAKNQVPSFWDAAQGGNRLTGMAGLNGRTMASNHFEDLVRAWMQWPFRPEYTTFLGKSELSDGMFGDDEGHAGRRTNFST